LPTVNVVKLEESEQIFKEYQNAYYRKNSTLIVEMMDYYNLK
jgi:hypothetical protein